MDIFNYFVDPHSISDDGFSQAVVALLTYADAENYISTFKDNNVGIKDLSELCESDLIVMGVDSDEIREKILKATSQLPESTQYLKVSERQDFSQEDFSDIFNDNTKHLERICTSIMSTRILLKKKTPEDFIIQYPKTYATDVILKSIDKMEKALEEMSKNLMDFKKFTSLPEKSKFKPKKVLIGSIGGFVVAVLSYSLYKSIQNL